MAGRGLRGLLLTGVSMVLGWAYSAYLRRVDFPPDGVRVVPVLWLIGTVCGLGIALWTAWEGLRGRRWPLAFAAVGGALLAAPNVALAMRYLVAAPIGD